MPSASAAADTLPSLRASARCTAARSAWSRSRVGLDAPPSRSAAGNGFLRKTRVTPRRRRAPRGPDLPAAAAIDIGRIQKAGVRERQPEILHLDPPGGIADGNRDEIDETFREVGAAGGHGGR